jgi:hypothetical protein
MGGAHEPPEERTAHRCAAHNRRLPMANSQ